MTTTTSTPALRIETPFSVLQAQLDAIAAQMKVYEEGGMSGDSCAGLHDARAYDAATWSDGTPIEDHTYPPGAVAVDFTYIYAASRASSGFGLETTVFDAAGNVIDSQDWG